MKASLSSLISPLRQTKVVALGGCLRGPETRTAALLFVIACPKAGRRIVELWKVLIVEEPARVVFRKVLHPTLGSIGLWFRSRKQTRTGFLLQQLIGEVECLSELVTGLKLPALGGRDCARDRIPQPLLYRCPLPMRPEFDQLSLLS